MPNVQRFKVVTVDISGKAGSGKTTVGTEIVRLMRSLGVPVTLSEDGVMVDIDGTTEYIPADRIENLAKHGLTVNVRVKQTPRVE